MQSLPEKELRQFALSKLGASTEDLSTIILSTDRLPAEDLRCLYSWADAFVLPTRGEGFGLPLAEAMASGLPTLSSDFGGARDMVRAAGVPLNGSVKSGEFEVSLSSLQNAMRAAQRGEYEGLGAQARSYVSQTHSPEVIAESLVQLIASSFPPEHPDEEEAIHAAPASEDRTAYFPQPEVLRRLLSQHSNPFVQFKNDPAWQGLLFGVYGLVLALLLLRLILTGPRSLVPAKRDKSD
ncbi:unnamed protein product [Polarella glacialis]|uniref:Glycosyl transferase family 1 domain-containing protein n=1 Tax=Polarella glacialis TaxID=89957 RepID=A0A813HNY1_POLGL|nr:unnamed protein product [Polarella glacialis]